jgi:glutaconyl-CoA/methylmalonyl-CoA decarboxylase subunit gamma
MRRYTIVVNGREFTLDVRELAADRFQVQMAGQEMEVLVSEDVDLPQASITPAIMGEQPSTPLLTTSVAIPPGPAGAPPPQPFVAASAVTGGRQTLTAPMPGTITGIDVVAGAKVKRGQVLMNLEAMKMLNPIRSPRDGVVADVAVKQGQTVAYGELLVRFEEAAG